MTDYKACTRHMGRVRADLLDADGVCVSCRAQEEEPTPPGASFPPEGTGGDRPSTEDAETTA